VSTVTPTRPMTTEEMLALPEDGMDRELIYGELREKPMTRRNRWHSRAEARISRMLDQWLENQQEPRGEVVSGEAGFRLRRDPDSTVGIDVAYVSAEVAARAPDAAYFEGPPVLAVEILSPSDEQQEIDDKVALYLETGVAVVWVVNPRFKTVCVYSPGVDPQMFSQRHELTAEPHLPGFRVAVTRLFGN
jgi:Uma2 family endonuclease